MSIFSIIYEGYNVEHNHYAKCLLLVQEKFCTVAYCYARSVEFKYPICSELEVEEITESFCAERSKELLDSFYIARDIGCSFICFIAPLQSNQGFFNSPRFSEVDFEKMITKMGGIKIPEISTKTPDFLWNGVVMELKDLQKEGLFDKDRQKSVGKLFKQLEFHTVNLDPAKEYGSLTAKYHVLIKNTIQNQVKKASEQVKAFRETQEIKAAGVILLNTGMFSLPDALFRSMVTHILSHQTKTITFALIFSQVAQSNGFDTIANFYCNFIGDVPDEILPLKDKVFEMIESKMTSLVRFGNQALSLPLQRPISFQLNNKIFYWNPGRLVDSRRE
nr:hypothetical protein [Mucilaginibacter sp. L294]